MLKSQIKLALRTLKKQRLYTVINIAGLSAGLLAFFLTAIYVKHERNYDKLHTKSERIARMFVERNGKNGAIVPYMWGSVLKDQWSEVENLATIQNITIALTVKKDDKVYAQHGFVGADSSFFDIFDFPAIEGNPDRFLKDPNKMVITPSAAAKYFGDENPIGQTLQVSLWGHYVTYEIDGIVECPENSHLQFQFVIPIHFVRQHFFSPTAFDSWSTRFAYTYILFKSKDIFTDPSVKAYLKDFLGEHGGDQLKQKFNPDIQPLEDIYLKSDLQFDFLPRGSIRDLKILIIAGFGILIMAIFNFMNISFARHLRSVKEIGLKRILGSSRLFVIYQLMIESVLLSLISLLLVLVFIALLLPYFNELTGKSMDLLDVFDPTTVLLLVGTSLIVGIMSGAYPAVVLSAVRPATILGLRIDGSLKSGKVRRSFVTLQFMLAIVLLVCTGIVYQQVKYLLDKDLGFKKDQVIVMQDVRVVATDPMKMQLLRNELAEINQIHHLSASSSYPGQTTWGGSFLPEGFDEEKKITISTIYTNYYFADTYELKIIDGRNFNRNIQSDSTSFLINEEAAKFFSQTDSSWVNPIGKKLTTPVFEGPVIGVVKDFHFEAPHKKIEPLIFEIDPDNFFNMQLQVETDNVASTLEQLESTWARLFPEIPFTYDFLDKEFSNLFDANRKLRRILTVFAMISVLIAVLGLFGLASFESFQKTKEMSIRKVVGASAMQVFQMLSWSFLKLVLLANALALPISYYFMGEWLNTFAYRIDMPILLFVISFFVTSLVALLTVLYHVERVARVNPVDVLVSE